MERFRLKSRFIFTRVCCEFDTVRKVCKALHWSDSCDMNGKTFTITYIVPNTNLCHFLNSATSRLSTLSAQYKEFINDKIIFIHHFMCIMRFNKLMNCPWWIVHETKGQPFTNIVTKCFIAEQFNECKHAQYYLHDVCIGCLSPTQSIYNVQMTTKKKQWYEVKRQSSIYKWFYFIL